MAKQATTIAIHVNLALRDFAVDMCTNPWIVELSRNSFMVEWTIIGKFDLFFLRYTHSCL